MTLPSGRRVGLQLATQIKNQRDSQTWTIILPAILRRGNFGGAVVHSMLLIYSPDGTNVCGSRGCEFEGIGSVYGLKVVNSYSEVQAFPCRLAQTLLLYMVSIV